MSQSGKKLIEEWFQRVWNNKESKAIDELMCEHCVVEGLESPELKRQGFANVYQAFQSTFSAIHIQILEMVEENGKVIGHAYFTGIHNKTKNKVDMVFSFSATWKDGKITSARNVVDFTTLLTQMNALDKAVMVRAFQA